MSFRATFLSFLFFGFCASCVQTHPSSEKDGKYTDFQEIEIKYAKGFSISRSDTSTYLFIFDPSSGKALDSLNISGLNSDEVRYFQKIVAQSTTHFAFLQSIEKLDALLGLCGINYLDVLQKNALGATSEICNAQGLDIEQIVNLDPDLVFLYPFGDKDKEQLKRLNINTLFLTEYMETSPLARAEWLKFFALITGVNTKNTDFEHIEQVYLNLIQAERETHFHPADKYSDADLFSPDKSIPAPNTVVFNLPYGDTWDMPAGNSISATLVKDAGLKYFLRNEMNSGNLLFKLEEAYNYLSRAEFWVIIAARPNDFSLNDLLAENRIYSTFPSVQFRKVIFCNTSATPYFSQGPIEPHILLQDLINCIEGVDSQNKYFFLLQ